MHSPAPAHTTYESAGFGLPLAPAGSASSAASVQAPSTSVDTVARDPPLTASYSPTALHEPGPPQATESRFGSGWLASALAGSRSSDTFHAPVGRDATIACTRPPSSMYEPIAAHDAVPAQATETARALAAAGSALAGTPRSALAGHVGPVAPAGAAASSATSAQHAPTTSHARRRRAASVAVPCP